MMNQMWKSKRKFSHLFTARLQIFQYWHSMKISFAIMGSGKNALLVEKFLILLTCLYGCIFIHTIQSSIAEKSFSPIPKTNIGILSVCILRQQAWISTESIREKICFNFDTSDRCLVLTWRFLSILFEIICSLNINNKWQWTMMK